MAKIKPNFKIITYSVIALIFLYLSYKVNWLFLIPVAVLIYLNQKELIK